MTAWVETIGGQGPTLRSFGEEVPEQSVRNTLLEGLTVFVNQLLWSYESGRAHFVELEQWKNHVDVVSTADRDVGSCLSLATALLVEPLGVVPEGGLATGLADEEDHYEMVWEGDGRSLTVFIYGNGEFDWLQWSVAGDSLGEEGCRVGTIGELVHRIRQVVMP